MSNSWMFFFDVVVIQCHICGKTYLQRRNQLRRSREGRVNRRPVRLPGTHGDFLTASESCGGLEGATKVSHRQRLTTGRTAGQGAPCPSLDGSLRAVLPTPSAAPAPLRVGSGTARGRSSQPRCVFKGRGRLSAPSSVPPSIPPPLARRCWAPGGGACR